MNMKQIQNHSATGHLPGSIMLIIFYTTNDLSSLIMPLQEKKKSRVGEEVRKKF